MEHALVDVVGEQVDGVDVARRTMGHTYVGEGHGSKADCSESMAKHGQGIDRWGIDRDGICFHGAKPEAQNVGTAEAQGCDSVPLKWVVCDEDTINA